MINRPFSIDALLDFDQFLPILDEIGPKNDKKSAFCYDQEMRYTT